MTDRPIIFSAPMIRALLQEAKEQGTGKSMTRRLLYTKRTARNGMIPASASFLIDHPPPRGRISAAGWPTDIAPNQYYTISPWQRVKPGDRLWVRENWRVQSWDEDSYLWIKYPADDSVKFIEDSDPDQAERLCESVCSELDKAGEEQDEQGFYKSTAKLRTRPSIHLPRWASRLTLVVTRTKIEHLQHISEQDCECEGLVWVPTQKIWGVKVDGGYSPYGLTGQECFMNLFCDLHGPSIWRDNPEVVVITFSVHKTNIDAMPKEIAA